MTEIKWTCISLIALGLFSGCATSSRYKMTTNEQLVHGATGVVSVVPTDSNNTKMRLNIKHLYPANKIRTGATNYIVWVKPEGSGTYQNVGALQVDNMLQVEYATTVPFASFNVIVTPEAGNHIQTPTGPAVLAKRIIR